MKNEAATNSESQVILHIAKKPSSVGVEVSSIIDDFRARDFLIHFNSYLQKINPGPHAIANNHTRFSTYKRIALILPPIPEVSSNSFRDVVHCTKAVPQIVTENGIKHGVPAKFSTVLVRVEKSNPALGPMDGMFYEYINILYHVDMTILMTRDSDCTNSPHIQAS